MRAYIYDRLYIYKARPVIYFDLEISDTHQECHLWGVDGSSGEPLPTDDILDECH